MKKRFTSITIILLGCLFCILLSSVSNSSELTLGIANSTCATMKKAGKIFTAKTNIKLKLLCQPSGLLAQGIIEGVLDVDYFLSANEKWMNDVVAAELINSATIRKNWANKLVLASLPLKADELKLQCLADLNKSMVRQVLIGDPEIAPYGVYAKEALVNAGLWEKVQAKLKYNRKINMSVRTLKKYGLSRTGVVALIYQTNTIGSLLTHNVKGDLSTHFEVPQHLYARINYFCAPLIKSRHKDELAQFCAFINSEEVKIIFGSAGFIINPTTS